MIKEKSIVMKWNNATRKRYENLGYKFTNYGDEFIVNIKDVPLRSEIKITAICEYCKSEKVMTIHAYNHITDNASKKYRCRKCFIEDKALTYEMILDDFNKTEYNLVTSQKDYVNGNTRIIYNCPKHGTQEMRASNFHNGKRCPKCAKDRARLKYAHSPDEVFDMVEKVGGKLLNKEEYINSQTNNLKIICPRCQKNILVTSLSHFLQHGGQACKQCYRKESVGERRIRQWLENNNIQFVQEKWFDDCRDNNPLPFDFYLPDNNLLIEYDGKQHFEETHFFIRKDTRFNDSVTSYIKFHDQIKTEYCKKNNHELLRIPYTKINDIENILSQKLIA